MLSKILKHTLCKSPGISLSKCELKCVKIYLCLETSLRLHQKIEGIIHKNGLSLTRFHLQNALNRKRYKQFFIKLYFNMEMIFSQVMFLLVMQGFCNLKCIIHAFVTPTLCICLSKHYLIHQEYALSASNLFFDGCDLAIWYLLKSFVLVLCEGKLQCSSNRFINHR